jgi:hypothetical protein
MELWHTASTSRIASRKIGLCCKNSLPNAADVEDYILFCLGSHSKQGGDEYHLTPDISFLDTVYLPLPHHIHRFVSLERSPCRFKREEAQPWFDQPFDEPMILLYNIVEVLDADVSSQPSNALPSAFSSFKALG